MFGNWRWNLFFGLFGTILIMLLSLFQNPLITSLIRGAYAFVTFFVFAFPIRYVAGMIFLPKEESTQASQQEDEASGTNVNLSTPDESSDLNDLLKAQLTKSKSDAAVDKQEAVEETKSFEPLKPPQLVSTEKLQTEEMTKAIRHLTGE